MRFVMSAVLLAAMAGGPVAHAVEIPGTKGILELGGFVDALGVVATEGGHYQQPQGLVSLQADADVRRWLSAHAELRGAVGGPFEDADAGLFGFNRTFQNYSPSLDFTEAYIDIQLPYSFELRGGIQRFAWGKLDGFPPTDLLNPRSFHDFLVQDFEEAKVGIPAVQAAYFPEDIPALSLSQLRAALIYVPIAVPARLALPGERWFPPSIEIDSVTVSSTQTGQVASICLDAGA